MPRKQQPLPDMPGPSGTFAGHDVEERHLGIIGAGALRLDQALEAGEEIELTIRARHVRTEHSLKTRGRRQGGGTYARERLVVTATEMVKIENLGPPALGEEGGESDA